MRPYLLNNRLCRKTGYEYGTGADDIRKFIIKDVTEGVLILGIDCVGRDASQMSVVADGQLVTVETVKKVDSPSTASELSDTDIDDLPDENIDDDIDVGDDDSDESSTDEPVDDTPDEPVDDTPDEPVKHEYEIITNTFMIRPYKWQIRIDCEYDPMKATAKVENGICTIKIPKRNTEAGKKLL